MHCIVTAGPTFEPLDEVRRLTNFSTGRLGTELANFLTAQGHEVTLLVGETAAYRGERRAKKISTRNGNLMVELVPTPKIIAELRGWFPQAMLCGWKFEANGGRTDALRAAERQMADCGTNFCVANGPAYGKGFCLVGQAARKHFARSDTLFRAFEKML